MKIYLVDAVNSGDLETFGETHMALMPSAPFATLDEAKAYAEQCVDEAFDEGGTFDPEMRPAGPLEWTVPLGEDGTWQAEAIDPAIDTDEYMTLRISERELKLPEGATP